MGYVPPPPPTEFRDVVIANDMPSGFWIGDAETITVTDVRFENLAHWKPRPTPWLVTYARDHWFELACWTTASILTLLDLLGIV